MTGVRLRSAGPSDVRPVATILSAFIDDTEWIPRIHSRAEDLAHAETLIDRDWVTVAETDRGVMGFLARDGAMVHALYVAAPAQGRGMGQRLVDQAKGTSPALDLWTFAANTGAHRFYRRLGFVEVARSDGSDNDEGLPDIHFRWIARDTS